MARPFFSSGPSPSFSFPLKHAGLLGNAANHLCDWTFSLRVSLLTPLTLGPEHAGGASGETHPLWGVIALLRVHHFPLETYNPTGLLNGKC